MDVAKKSYKDASVQTSPPSALLNNVKNLYSCLGVASAGQTFVRQQVNGAVGQDKEAHNAYLAHIYDSIPLVDAPILPKRANLGSQRLPGATMLQRRIVSLPEQTVSSGRALDGFTESLFNSRCVSMPLRLHARRNTQQVLSDEDFIDTENNTIDSDCRTSRNDPADVYCASPPKPIPALHGPSTLPYARCPSGADGIVVETPSELPHLVWGLDGNFSKRHEEKMNTENGFVFHSIANEEQCGSTRDTTQSHDEEIYGAPLPPAYESPVFEDVATLPFYDQAIVALGDYNRWDDSIANTMPPNVSCAGEAITHSSDQGLVSTNYLPMAGFKRNYHANVTRSPHPASGNARSGTLLRGYESDYLCGLPRESIDRGLGNLLLNLNLKDTSSANHAPVRLDTQPQFGRNVNVRDGCETSMAQYPRESKQNRDSCLPSMPISLHQLVSTTNSTCPRFMCKTEPSLPLDSPDDAYMRKGLSGESRSRGRPGCKTSVPVRHFTPRVLTSVPEEALETCDIHVTNGRLDIGEATSGHRGDAFKATNTGLSQASSVNIQESTSQAAGQSQRVIKQPSSRRPSFAKRGRMKSAAGRKG